ncbi:hypothetical protein [Pseudanabaena yagii]|nr:hypothetical protein [Pseudanabaena yagii]
MKAKDAPSRDAFVCLILQPVEALSSIEIFLKAALRAAFKNISGF